ncbi:DUF916 domain-containing protein [Bacillus cereus]|uniref:WxL protein peptidoglycan domain-containing protein n=1 Tax=Bacillus cereus TaxID=1396 RepID=UPI003078C13D
MKKSIFAFFVLISIVLKSNISYAALDNFVVKPSLTENQRKGVTNYFSLNMDKNTKEFDLTFDIYNPNEKTISVAVFPGDAITSSDGEIIITKDSAKLENQILNSSYKFSNYITVQDKVVLKPKEKKKVSVHIKSPSVKTGSYVGGVIFEGDGETEIKKGDIKKKESVVFQIKNKFQFAYAIELIYDNPFVNSEKTFLQIDDGVIFKKYGKPQGRIYISNIANQINRISDIFISTKKGNESTVLFKDDLIKFTPYTKIAVDFPITDIDTSKDNNEITIQYTENGKKFTETRTLHIAEKKEEISKGNAERVDIDTLNKDSNFNIYLCIVLGGLFVIGAVIISYRMGKKQKNKN